MATSSEIIYNLQLSDSLFDMRKRFDCYVTLVSKLFKWFSFADHISIRKHIIKKTFHSSIKRLYRYDTAKGKLSPIARGIVNKMADIFFSEHADMFSVASRAYNLKNNRSTVANVTEKPGTQGLASSPTFWRIDKSGTRRHRGNEDNRAVI